MFRKTIFWIHLSSGVLAGLLVFVMSLTGVLLAYERQIKGWVAQSHYVPAAAQTTRMPLVQLLADFKRSRPELQPNSLMVSNDPGAPVALRAGRAGSFDLDPYTAQTMQTESAALNDFFETVEHVHRWLNLSGEARTTARAVMDGANGLFLFLVLSGLYLWLPPLWKQALFKARVWLRTDYTSSKVRDFHWHHVFGIWMALPLLAVVYSGMVMTYPWAANLLYTAFGAEIPAPPAGPGGPPPGFGGGPNAVSADNGSAADASLSLDALLQSALADPASAGWKRATLSLPTANDKNVRIEIDQGNGAQAHLRHTLILDRQSGDIKQVREFGDTPKAQRLRGIARFLHTGEVLGWWGQTLAALASAAAMMLVWTGLSLAWRRLIQPLFNR
jgi:uncharacterized iron-regulated membrane protein